MQLGRAGRRGEQNREEGFEERKGLGDRGVRCEAKEGGIWRGVGMWN